MSTYNEILKKIQVDSFYGGKERVTLLKKILKVLSNPETNYNIIHVAGTNGKGSTCKMTSEILSASGFKTGLFTSPHLYDSKERIMIDGLKITEEEFVDCYNIIENAINKINVKVYDLSFFEWYFLIAIYHFYKNNVSFVVLETGMGGEFDATNAIEHPIVVAFTKIDLDHTNVLGKTIEDIARTKSKIIKNECSVVNYCDQNKSVNEIIVNESKIKNANYYLANIKKLEILEEDINKSVINIETNMSEFKNLKLNLAGYYQIINLSTVLTIIEVLNLKGFCISHNNIISALSSIVFHGRMELVNTRPKIIIDGAHNPNGTYQLIKSLNRYKLTNKYVFVIGFLQDKNFQENLKLIIPQSKLIIITQPKNYERALSLDDLQFYIEKIMKELNITVPYFKEKDIKKALQLAKQLANPNDLICCTGSFYLIKEINKAKNI